jgi:hypothetical protein
METHGFSSYADVEEFGIVDCCPECPEPGVNLKPGWENDPNRSVLLRDLKRLSLAELLVRDLLYVIMLSGDGNFHLQSYSRYGGEHQSPSIYGDFGFWVPYEIARKYTEWADSQKSYPNVRL